MRGDLKPLFIFFCLFVFYLTFPAKKKKKSNTSCDEENHFPNSLVDTLIFPSIDFIFHYFTYR